MDTWSVVDPVKGKGNWQHCILEIEPSVYFKIHSTSESWSNSQEDYCCKSETDSFSVVFACKDLLISESSCRADLKVELCWIEPRVKLICNDRTDDFLFKKCLFKLGHNWNYNNVHTSSCHICSSFWYIWSIRFFKRALMYKGDLLDNKPCIQKRCKASPHRCMFVC